MLDIAFSPAGAISSSSPCRQGIYIFQDGMQYTDLVLLAYNVYHHVGLLSTTALAKLCAGCVAFPQYSVPLAILKRTSLPSYRIISVVCFAVFWRRPASKLRWDFRSGYGWLALGAASCLPAPDGPACGSL